jgi:hypothetical protein
MPENETGGLAEPSALQLVDRDEQDDAQLRALAYQAFQAIAVRTRRGEPARAVVADVIGTVFGAGSGGDSCDDRRVTALLHDPAALDRIVGEVLTLVEAPGTL